MTQDIGSVATAQRISNQRSSRGVTQARTAVVAISPRTSVISKAIRMMDSPIESSERVQTLCLTLARPGNTDFAGRGSFRQVSWQLSTFRTHLPGASRVELGLSLGTD